MARQNTYTKSIKDPSSHPYPLSKEEVARLYYDEQLSLDEVAARARTSRQRLARWMESWRLPRRTGTEGRKVFTDRRGLPRSPNWQGGKWKIESSNTWFTYAPKHPRSNHAGAVMTHVLVAEGRIGRYVRPHEHVHHLNRDRDDYSPENLCVMLRGEHALLHNLLGAVGIALLARGHTDLVLNAIADDAHRRFVRAVYVDLTPCVSGLLAPSQRKEA